MPHPFTYRGRQSDGFTLLEIVLYIGVAAVVLLAVSVVITFLLQARLNYQAMAEVEQQGAQVMIRLTQLVRNAESVLGPSAGTSGSSLSFDTYVTQNNPTIVDDVGGSIRLTEGAAPVALLTNARVVASAVTVQNVSRVGTPGIVRVQFNLRSVYPNAPAAQQYQKTFTMSAGLRQP
jgi:hypothetical protein